MKYCPYAKVVAEWADGRQTIQQIDDQLLHKEPIFLDLTEVVSAVCIFFHGKD